MALYVMISLLLSIKLVNNANANYANNCVKVVQNLFEILRLTKQKHTLYGIIYNYCVIRMVRAPTNNIL